MMDHINDILATDLLERYVLGDVTKEEQMKVDLLRIDHKLVRDKLADLELTMERTAIENSVKAPDSVRECIIKNIHGDHTESITSQKSASFKSSWLAMAASLLLGCFSTWLIMNNQLSSAKKVNQEQAADLEILHRDCDQLTKQYAFINHTNTIPVLLEGNVSQDEHQVVVYWNDRLQRSMLRVINLPGLKTDETFQLWADVDGKMKSLGVFDAGQAIADAIPMNYLDNAASLNITIEPKGGSEHPDVSRLTASQII